MAEGVHPSASPVLVEPVLLGRAFCASGSYSVHLFGAVNPSVVGAPATYTTFPERRALNRTDCKRRKGAGWYRAVIAGKEVQRSGTFGPLTDLSIFSGGPPDLPGVPVFPAGIVASMSGRSEVKVSLGINDGTNDRWLSFDVGQSIDFVAACATAVFHAPAGYLDVATAVPPVPPQTGLLIDAYVSVHFWEIEEPLQFRGHLTRHLFVPADTQVVIPVPDGAREVQIVQSTIGDAAAVFTLWYGDPTILAAATEHGTLAFEPGLRQTPIKFVGDSTHLRSDLAETDRFFTVVWQIEP